jgi:hypothetical protein
LTYFTDLYLVHMQNPSKTKSTPDSASLTVEW